MNLTDIYNRLKSSAFEGEIDLIPDVIPAGHIHDTLEGMIITPKFTILPDKEQTIVEPDNIVLAGTTKALELPARVQLSFSERNGMLRCTASFVMSQTWQFGNISWFKFENPEIHFLVYEDNHPLTGKIGGVLDLGTPAQLFLQFPSSIIWRWSCLFPKPYPGIGTFFHLIGGDDITKAFPEPISTFADIGVSGIDMEYNAATQKLSHITFTVSTNHPWPILHDLLPGLNLQVSGISISCKVNLEQPSVVGSLPRYQFAISGLLSVKEKLNVTISAVQQTEKDWIISAFTPSNEAISLADIASLFIGDNASVPAELTAIAFSGVGISISTGSSALTFTANSAHAWQLTESFSVQDFSIVLNRQPSAANPFNGRLSCGFQIYELEILLSAELGAAGTGWNFAGSVRIAEGVSIVDIVKDIAGKFNVPDQLPKPLAQLAIKEISVAFNTQTKDFSFSLETKFPIDSKELDAVIKVELTHNNGKYTHKFSGIVKVGDLELDLIFNQEQDADTIFLAAFENNAGKDESIMPLVELITDNTDVLKAANGISFNLKDALLVVDKGVTTKILFGLDIGGGLDISKLPLVGKMLPENATVRMTFQPLLTNEDFLPADLNKVRPLVPAGGFNLPQEAKERLGFSMQLMVGDQKFDLSLPISVNDVKTQPSTTSIPATTSASTDNTTAAPPAASANIKWFVIQRQLGPVNFGRIGVQFQDAQLYFLLDASLSLAGLTISLDGLFVSSTLNPIHPRFGLHGMGIDYKKGPLEIGGAFLRQTITDKAGNTYDTYDGKAIIRTEKFTIAAMGSYAFHQGHPSLFIYAFADWPIGGPSFFFVTGLAAGFGYNRRVVVPTLEGVRTFPLVAQALSGPPDTTNGLSGVISQLHEVLTPAAGEYFFAVGIRFTSFKIIDSFVLLIVNFGLELEVDVLGISTLVMPTPKDGSTIEPLAEVKLAMRAVFNPAKGYLKVQAALAAGSYILSRNCHLTGGFAFYAWFKDNPEDGAAAGDFVLTMGGYHPRFKPPAHYPRVAPLGFNWQVIPELAIKGDFYFALVPSAVMAGGHLSALWKSGNLSAWFNIGADFIISWKPYFYDASMYLDMGVSYTYQLFGTHQITLDVGADLHIWGPEFSGIAHVHLWIVTFEIGFGANSKQEPEKLSWEEFRTGFLPDNSKWESVSVARGLVKKLGTEADPLFVVNPKDFMLETGSAIPITASNQLKGESLTRINIGSMGIDDNVLLSTHDITIRFGADDVTADFTYAPIKKNVPGALWGSIFKHSEAETEEQRLVKNACMGFSITGKPVTASGNTHDVASEKLFAQEETFDKGNPIAFGAPVSLKGAWLKTAGVRDSIFQNIEARSGERSNLLKALGIPGDYFPNKELANEFILTTGEPA